MFRILTINPGSTSTKIGIYEDTREVLAQNLSHSADELAEFPTITDQFDYRLGKIMDFLAAQNLSPRDFAAIVGRGGLLKPMVSGTYLINEAMLDDLKHSRYGAHASNLGAILAAMLAKEAGCPAYIVDPVVVDELEPVARITGRPEIERRSIFHALNQKAVAKRFAKSINRPYEELNLIVAHLGGGISVGCHKQGRVVEVNNALDGEGPFSPERAGTMPAGQFADLILSEGLRREMVAKMLAGKGGLVAHLGTNDAREVEKRIAQGDKEAKLVYDAMIYQVARAIAAAAVPVCGKVDHILLTGGIAYSKYLTGKLEEYIGFIAPIVVLPGENELQALAEGAYRVLTGEEQAKEYR
ncbi:acetate and butyrate kinase [Thermosinus carboxydivorans Nor1]|uniref:Probable butyrate kinase n=1 Tax=Thermosinus carboxydivorans Nor1 TaxID=401526 RepID=A1HLR4_9FIRM|nr:butyrate kinase [Thermosinus carboxydivorans]EAX48771.1 acetate and butyrate kinase [Thermosinus carboxydivorans Nor1]